MIRYEVDFEQLERDVDATHPTWRARATECNQRMWCARPRCFDESGPSWSDVKRFFLALQHGKCAYCERKLEGAIEGDIDHYRPKRSVRPWTGDRLEHGNTRGYCMLAYELRNYCVACKTCNTTHKSDHFPIAGKPGRADARDIAKLNDRERPLLPYPLGQLDDDPESLITFVGFLPIPRQRSGQGRRRAQVTIAVFALNSRTELTRGRSAVVRALWLLLLAAESADGADDRTLAQQQINLILSGREPHTACARAFVRLFEANRNAAHTVYVEACDHLARTS